MGVGRPRLPAHTGRHGQPRSLATGPAIGSARPAREIADAAAGFNRGTGERGGVAVVAQLEQVMPGHRVHPPPHVGFACGDERRTVDGGGEKPRACRYEDGREALRTSAPSFIADAIKAGAPRYRVRDEKRVVPLR
jgi:hypothetical protein